MFLGPEAPVSVYAVHPGIVRTEFFRDFPRYQQWVLSAVSWLICKHPWYGAQTTIYCAVDESIKSETGKYYRYGDWFRFRFAVNFNTLVLFVLLISVSLRLAKKQSLFFIGFCHGLKVCGFGMKLFSLVLDLSFALGMVVNYAK